MTTATAMLQLGRYFFELICLRLAPQAFPPSRFLLFLTAGAFLCSAMLLHARGDHGIGLAVGRSLLGLFNQLFGAWLILSLFQKSARWLQASIALLGGDTLFALLNLPLFLLVSQGAAVLAAYLFLGLVAWQVLFFAHVYRHALDTRLGPGILVAMIYVLCSWTIKQALMPLPVA